MRLRLIAASLIFLSFYLSASAQEVRAGKKSVGGDTAMVKVENSPAGDQVLAPFSLIPPVKEDSTTSVLNPSESGIGARSWLSIPGADRNTLLSVELFPVRPTYYFLEPAVQSWRSESWLLESRSNLLSPLILEWKSEKSLRMWQNILGSVEAGGVAYLMYLHIKKYGLK